MKKINILSFFLLLMLPILSGCKEDNILFESELPRFELREGYQLLEVIVPSTTGLTDKIYITGEFNGGEDAIGDPRWLLEKAHDYNYKFGIYLDPNTFLNGKTLADGYSFFNVSAGEERNLDNKPVVHKEYPPLGQRINVLVQAWADNFDKPQSPDEIQHDGYAIFVVNNTSWDELALYAWGDAEAFGPWPGMQPTGKMTQNGVTYTYFDTGAANEGLNLNLIFNNNGGGIQLADYNVTLDQDYYLEINDNGVNAYDPSGDINHDGYAIYVYDLSGWDTLYLYSWGAVNDLHGAWPGMPVTGTQTINGITYKYFDLGDANTNIGEQHIILNNGDGGKQIDDVAVFNLDHDIYIELTSTTATQIDPNTYTPGGGSTDNPGVDPEPDQPSLPGNTYYLYVENKTGWSDFYVYAWGASEAFGGWPGQTSTVTKTINGKNYLVFPMSGGGEELNLIFSDGHGSNDGGVQYDVATIIVDRDYFFTASATSATQESYPVYSLYIENKTGWNSFYVYAWGDEETFGAWPGRTPSSSVTQNGVEYSVLKYVGYGQVENLIFNDNAGTQYDAMQLQLDKDYYLIANPQAAQLKQ